MEGSERLEDSDEEPPFHPFGGAVGEKGSVERGKPTLDENPECIFGRPCTPLGEQCSAFKCAAAHSFLDDLGL